MKNKYNFQEKDRILVFLVIKSELPIGQGKRKKNKTKHETILVTFKQQVCMYTLYI